MDMNTLDKGIISVPDEIGWGTVASQKDFHFKTYELFLECSI